MLMQDLPTIAELILNLNGKCFRVAETFSPYITARQFDAFRFEIQDEFGDCGQVLHEHKT